MSTTFSQITRRSAIALLALSASVSSSADAAAFLKSESAKWEKVIRDANIKAD